MAVRERDVKAYLKRRVKELDGEMRKVKWEGRRNAPDWLVMLPCKFLLRYGPTQHDVFSRDAIWVELKTPGEKATPAQAREHKIMRDFGLRVEVVDSYERVEEILR